MVIVAVYCVWYLLFAFQQFDVLKTLEENQFPHFLMSSECRKMLHDAADSGIILTEITTVEQRSDVVNWLIWHFSFAQLHCLVECKHCEQILTNFVLFGEILNCLSTYYRGFQIFGLILTYIGKFLCCLENFHCCKRPNIENITWHLVILNVKVVTVY